MEEEEEEECDASPEVFFSSFAEEHVDRETNEVRTRDDDTSRKLPTGGAEEARRRMSLVRALILFVTRRPR